MKRLLILLFIPSMLCAETKIIGHKYAIPKTEPAVIADTALMTGTKTDKERYLLLERKDISTTLDSYEKQGKCYKSVIKKIKEVRPNGVTVTFIKEEGSLPTDLNYSTEAEKKKAIEAEKARLRALQEKALEDQAKANLGL